MSDTPHDNGHQYPADTCIGILSDSHGQFDMTRNAIDVLTQAGAQVFIHTGDICDERVLDTLAGLKAHVVFGNCDWNWQHLARYAELLGVHAQHPCGRISVGEATIAFAHGDRPSHERSSVAKQVDYFCHGHTHEIRDERKGSTRVINPGALYNARRYTVATLHPARDVLEFLEVPSA
ncbi:MAG: metallophosphoesterase family protein [Planctomycetes bacterium]|nr:metallophosphoesterase family protein [Planctomycetota bacterium]